MVAPWRQDGRMPTLEERVAYLEGRLGDHFAAIDDLRSTYREFRADSNRQFGDVRAEVEHSRTGMARQFVELRGQVDDLRGDTARGFDEVRSQVDDLRADAARGFDEVRGRIDDLRGDTARGFDDVRGELRQEVRRLDGKLDTQFRWLAGMQVTTILAIGSAVVGLYFK
jgi:hypothetical protein